MKVTTLILAVMGAASLSSCCCQSQPVPPLRPMPDFGCGKGEPIAPPVEPIKVLDHKGK